MKEIIEDILQNRLVETIIIIIISFVLYSIFKSVITKGKKSKNYKEKLDNRQRTYVRLFTNILKYAFVIVTLLIVLQINGVNVTSMLAGVGIASVVVGLALQDALKDIIMGANIIADNFFSLGDVVKYKDIEGKVVSFGLKTTKIQDIATNNIVSITNRNIGEIEKVSNDIFIDIPVSYETKTEKMNEVGSKIAERLKQSENIEDCKYLGLDNLAESCIIYKLSINCKPEYKYPVKRQAMQIIKEELDKSNIEVPYPQINVHNK